MNIIPEFIKVYIFFSVNYFTYVKKFNKEIHSFM